MEKILSLKSEHFLKGLTSAYDEQTGIFNKAEGVDLFRNMGLISSGYDPIDLDPAGAVVLDKIKWLVPYAGTTKQLLYGYGSTGRMYQTDMGNGSDTVSDITGNSNIAVSTGQGMVFYKGAIIYRQTRKVGKITNLDANPRPTFDSSGIMTGLAPKNYAPIWIGPDDNCYISDTASLHRWNGNNTTRNVVSFPAGFEIATGSHDGNYLIIGGSNRNQATYRDPTAMIYFWDCWSPGINKRYPIPDPIIYEISPNIGGWHYAFTGMGIWQFNYDTPPQLIQTRGGIDSATYCRLDTGGGSGGSAIDIWRGMLLWGGSWNCWSYGFPTLNRPPIFTNPFRVEAPGENNSKIRSLKVMNYNLIYVGAGNTKFYKFAGDGYSRTTITTPLIDLGSPIKISGIKLLGKALMAGASITIKVQDEAGSDIISGQYSFAKDGAKSSKFISRKAGTAKPIADQIIITATTTGNVGIKRIDLYGEKIEDFYA